MSWVYSKVLVVREKQGGICEETEGDAQIWESWFQPTQHPSSDVGGTFVTTCLRKGKNSCAGAGITGVRNCERNILQEPRSVEEERQEMLDLRFPCSPWRWPWWGRCGQQSKEVHNGAEIHLQPQENPMPENTDVPEEICSLWREVHRGAVFWAGAVARGAPRLKQSTCEELHPETGFMTEQFLKNSSPCEAPRLKKLLKDCTLWTWSNAAAEEDCEEEWAAVMKC